MAVINKLLALLSFTLLSNPILASNVQAQDWTGVSATLRTTLETLQVSHNQYLTQAASKLWKRDATFRTGPAGYWKPVAAGKRMNTSDDFSTELNGLISDIGDAVEQLLALLASPFNTGGIFPNTTTTSTSQGPTILPITNLNPTPTVPATATTSRSLVPDRPLSTIILPNPSSTQAFDPLATDLNVAYYSQTDQTPVISLTQVCNDPNVDIVILAFATNLVAAGGYPAMNMASNCWAPNAAQQAAGATGLLDCVSDGLSSKITKCQQQGKKVMLSLGGSVGDLSLTSDDQAQQVANTLWNLFLGGNDPTVSALRPYGTVVLDGIDIDSELPSASTHLPALARTLRQLMSQSTTPNRAYYMSAAPQCPRPDASIPVANLLPYIDFFSVQFYNNPSCNLNAPNNGFVCSLQAWSSDLLALGALEEGSKSRIKRTSTVSVTSGSNTNTSTNTNTGFMAINNGISAPRLLIGTPAFPGAGSGYVDVPTYIDLLQQVKALNLPNLAGAMYWDGAYLEESAVLVDGVSTTFAMAVRDIFA